MDMDLLYFVHSFNWFTTSDAVTVGTKIGKYASLPGQLLVDGKVFASSFAGDGVDSAAIRSAAGTEIYWAPNFHPSEGTDLSQIDGALNWIVGCKSCGSSGQ